MTGRRALAQRRGRLDEVRGILRSMKNLAYMETRKLQRLIENQREVVAAVDAAAADFLAWYPYTLPRSADARPVLLVTGSERGFVGDLNERLLQALERRIETEGDEPDVIAVGTKLVTKLEDHPRLAATVEGPDVAEEILPTLFATVAEVDRLRERHGPLSVEVIYVDARTDRATIQPLLPPFESHIGKPPEHPFAPVITLPPARLLVDLAEQFLCATLRDIGYEALLAENQRRVRQLDGAVRHLDEKTDELDRRLRQLRQEEIIEEIEVILLNSAGE